MIKELLVIILLGIIFLLFFYSPKSWKLEPGINYVRGKVQPHGNSENVKYLGEYQTADLCHDACDDDLNCEAYTWYDDKSGSYSSQCYGVRNIPARVPDLNSVSGYAEHYQDFEYEPLENDTISNWNLGDFRNRLGAAWKNAQENLSKFSNTLQRRAGLKSSGKTVTTPSGVAPPGLNKEGLVSGDVGYGTVYAGYQNRVILPDYIQ
jgi:hypothetical protein